MPRPPCNRTTEAPLLKYKTRRKNKHSCLIRCCIITLTTVIILLLLAFIIIFVVIPLIFKFFVELQRDFVFPIYDLHPDSPDFKNFSRYDIYGARNLYVHVNKTESILLGVWHLLPEVLANSSIENTDFNYTEALASSEYPVILHFHGNGGNRASYPEMYNVLREFFHVIAFDYRCYGDSSRSELTEEGIVEDSIELYKWLSSQTTADIYIWGHSLGSALGTHVTAKLRDENIIPAGLFLESPFTSMKDEVKHVQTLFWFTRVFRWLPWYEATMVDPFEEHGFCFNTIKHILQVDCPIMIVHAEDDSIVPFEFGKKLYETAADMRNTSFQGNVTFYPLSSSSRYDHWQIYASPDLPIYVSNQIEICKMFKNEK